MIEEVPIGKGKVITVNPSAQSRSHCKSLRSVSESKGTNDINIQCRRHWYPSHYKSLFSVSYAVSCIGESIRVCGSRSLHQGKYQSLW
jgi:hypothetical protein